MLTPWASIAWHIQPTWLFGPWANKKWRLAKKLNGCFKHRRKCHLKCTKLVEIMESKGNKILEKWENHVNLYANYFATYYEWIPHIANTWNNLKLLWISSDCNCPNLYPGPNPQDKLLAAIYTWPKIWSPSFQRMPKNTSDSGVECVHRLTKANKQRGLV